MPILNPQTGEQDYVDVRMLDKILLDKIFLVDASTKKSVAIQPRFEVDVTENDKPIENIALKIVTVINDLNFHVAENFSLSKFEEIMSQVVHEDKYIKLEDHLDFMYYLQDLVYKFKKELKKQNILLLEHNEEHKVFDGIGIIYNQKNNREIGTFEELIINVDKFGDVYHKICYYFIPKTNYAYLEKTPLKFVYYSPERKKKYEFISNKDEVLSIKEKFHFPLSDNYSVKINDFDESDPYYSTITEFLKDKYILTECINTGTFEKLYESRYKLIEHTKKEARKKSIINQFSDIEL